jgi:hypothetical protein
MRGWPVPYIDPRGEVIRGENWIGEDVDATVVGHYEAWRFYTSGQFNHLRAVGADWRHTAEIWSASPLVDKVIEVWEILFYLTETFELAARLALTAAGDDAMIVDVRLCGLDGRELIFGDPSRAGFLQPRRTQQDSLTQRLDIPREELVANSRAHAVGMAREFFARFGWNAPHDQLVEYQRELTELRS